MFNINSNADINTDFDSDTNTNTESNIDTDIDYDTDTDTDTNIRSEYFDLNISINQSNSNHIEIDVNELINSSLNSSHDYLIRNQSNTNLIRFYQLNNESNNMLNEINFMIQNNDYPPELTYLSNINYISYYDATIYENIQENIIPFLLQWDIMDLNKFYDNIFREVFNITASDHDSYMAIGIYLMLNNDQDIDNKMNIIRKIIIKKYFIDHSNRHMPNQPINMSLIHLLNESINESTNNPTNESINESINELTNNPTNESTNNQQQLNSNFEQLINVEQFNEIFQQRTLSNINLEFEHVINQIQLFDRNREFEQQNNTNNYFSNLENVKLVISPDVLSNIPIMKYSKLMSINQTNILNKTCSICQEDFEQTDTIRQIKCGHVYHQFCIDKWLTKYDYKCPMCRKEAGKHISLNI